MWIFTFQGMVQFDSKSNQLNSCGDVVKWLDVFKCEGASYKQAELKAYKYFNNKYPKYKGYIQLF